jgi:hypothetical protein
VAWGRVLLLVDVSSMWQGAFKYKMKNVGVLYVVTEEDTGYQK